MNTASPTWRTIIALCRFAGLRCPSEVLTLRWADVNFETNRMTVSSPKTERIPGKEYRVMPIFAALRPHLDEAWELAEPGEVFVVGGPQGERYRAASSGPNGWVGANPRTTFEKLVRRAGLTAWPRLFHTLRASCETDLLEQFPISAVTEWLGHSRRWRSCTTRGFPTTCSRGRQRAVQIPVQWRCKTRCRRGRT